MDYEPIIIDKNTRKFNKGELKYIDKIPYLKVHGSYYEMGLQYGVLMRDKIKLLNREVRKLYKLSVPWYLRPLANVLLDNKLLSMEKRIPDKYKEELKGLSQGSGLPYKKILLFLLFPGGFHGKVGCTSILKRIDDSLFLARNLDYIPFLGKYPIVVEYNSSSNPKITSFGIIGFLGILTGMNKSGLSLSLNHVKLSIPNTSKDIPIGYKNRSILEKSTSLNDVDNNLKGYTSDTGWVITISSLIDNDGCIYDISPTTIKKHPLNSEKDIIANNSFLDSSLRHKSMSILTAGWFKNHGRYKTTQDQLYASKIKTIDELINLLSSIKFYEYEDFELGFGHYTINNEQTIQSIIIDTYKKESYFSLGTGFSGSGSYYKYNFNNSTIEIYTQKNKKTKERINKLLLRRDTIFKLLLLKEYSELAKYIVGLDNPTMDDLLKLSTLNTNIDVNALLMMIEIKIEKYSNLPQLHIKKGKLLINEKRFDEAIISLNKALTLPYLYPADILETKFLLFLAYNKKGYDLKANQYAKDCLVLINSYSISKDEEILLNRIEDINSTLRN